MPATNFAREGDKSYPVYSHHYLKFETKNRLEISTNSSSSIQLASFTSLTKPLYVINLSWPIPLALYFIKCKLDQKMPIFVMCLLKNKRNLVKKWAFYSFSTPLNIEKVLICHPVFDTNLFNRFFFGIT